MEKPGDPSLTLDTGLEWLDLTATAGRSYDDVAGDILLSSFRHATREEVRTLFVNAGFVFPTATATATGAANATNAAAADMLLDLMGCTRFCDGRTQSGVVDGLDQVVDHGDSPSAEMLKLVSSASVRGNPRSRIGPARRPVSRSNAETRNSGSGNSCSLLTTTRPSTSISRSSVASKSTFSPTRVWSPFERSMRMRSPSRAEGQQAESRSAT